MTPLEDLISNTVHSWFFLLINHFEKIALSQYIDIFIWKVLIISFLLFSPFYSYSINISNTSEGQCIIKCQHVIYPSLLSLSLISFQFFPFLIRLLHLQTVIIKFVHMNEWIHFILIPSSIHFTP